MVWEAAGRAGVHLHCRSYLGSVERSWNESESSLHFTLEFTLHGGVSPWMGFSPTKLSLRMHILHDVCHAVHPVCLGYMVGLQSTAPCKILFEVWPLEMHAEWMLNKHQMSCSTNQLFMSYLTMKAEPKTALKDWSCGCSCNVGSNNCGMALVGKQCLPTFKTKCVSFSKGNTKAAG